MQVSRGIDLVYGGGGIGLMGLVSQAVHRGGRRVIGYVRDTIYTPAGNNNAIRNVTLPVRFPNTARDDAHAWSYIWSLSHQ